MTKHLFEGRPDARSWRASFATVRCTFNRSFRLVSGGPFFRPVSVGVSLVTKCDVHFFPQKKKCDVHFFFLWGFYFLHAVVGRSYLPFLAKVLQHMWCACSILVSGGRTSRMAHSHRTVAVTTAGFFLKNWGSDEITRLSALADLGKRPWPLARWLRAWFIGIIAADFALCRVGSGLDYSLCFDEG